MRNILATCGWLFLCAISAFAQGGIESNSALKATAGVAASVRVCTAVATGTPCSPLASIYSDKTLLTAKSNPFASDSNGNYDYHCTPGYLKEQVTVGGSTFTRTVLCSPDVANTSVQELNNIQFCDQFAGANAGVKIQACLNALPSTGGTADARGFEGSQTISATITISKPVTLRFGNAVFSCSTGATNCFTATEQRDIIIRGAGANETTVQGSTTTTGTKFLWAGTGANGIFKFTGVENLEISDLGIDGNSVASGVGLELLTGSIDTSSILFRRLSVSYFAGKGIKLSAAAASNVDVSIFDDVTFRSNGIGLTMEGAQTVGWSFRQLRFINNTTGLETVGGGGFHCLNCSWSSTLDPSTAAKLTSISDNITFENNTWEMGPNVTAITSSASGGSPRMIVRVIGSRLDKSGTLGQDLITWNAQVGLYMEGNRIKDGVVRLGNVIEDMGDEAVHTFVGNWFDGTTGQANLVLDNTSNGNRVYNVYEFNNQQSTDITNGIRSSAVRYRRVSTSVVDRSEFGPALILNTPLVFTSLDTTPSVARGAFFKTANAGATNITAFDDGIRGQVIHIVFNDANTTVTSGGTLKLHGTLTPISSDSLTLLYDGTDWFELGRSSPSSTFKASAFISNAANPASAGAVRLASADCLRFRNNANGADVDGLCKDTLDVVKVGATGSAGVKIGDNANTAAVRGILTGTASLDFTALAANSCEVLTITVTGAADGDAVKLGVPNALADVDGATERTTFFPWVSAADTVSVRRCNVTGVATAEPAAATVRAVVSKF